MKLIAPLEKPGTATPIEKTSKARKATFLKIIGCYLGLGMVAAMTPEDTDTGKSVHKILSGLSVCLFVALIANAVMGWWERG